ncbi:hypothetical protein ABB37_09931 [Leptomonas pyrrhocoris]|uniref:RRM domain-containing protein n=1 Tax=Leptomonas pyrrhocoris TaxID=157538 RepID=A0A0N1J473_LEPPY|nr:hypothetical protein ABB37_09931 [Leptomonas pyrrhocoris]KPA73382.1 hypothetical protein ABB37_09931 [Leptomonas pyrrhocoris]|eukprot:XP_015651821.1 hypothetical protein ABB37_09931 [Leptomonas pyrrhocoris]
MFAASSSSHSTPRSGRSNYSPLPSFVVTSSNDTPFTNATASAKTAPTAALNPEAREFCITPSFGGSLFAMPAAAATLTPSRWGPTTTRDFPGRPPGSPHSPSPSPSAPAAALAETLDSARLVEFTEAYMHELYDRKCQEEGLHMVSVFHLHPRTTNKQLSSMFFPTGAREAEVLEARQMPEPLANAFNLVRQRAGAVFFTRKDFAMVGVEKVNDFVPHGQHQPLVVRYCGSGTPAALPTVPPLPVSTAKKAASPSSVLRPTPPSNFRDPAAATSAPPPDRLGSPAAAAASTYDAIDQHFLLKYAGDNVYLVGVHNLAYGTSAKSFYKMFYPMGAQVSELLPRPVSVDGKLRCSGVAIFASKGMAMEAAEKINDFVPHGQRRPVVARFLDRTPTPPLDVATISAAATGTAGDRREPPPQQHGALLASASTPRASASGVEGATAIPPVNSAAALLFAIERQLRAKAVSDSQLAADMCALVLCNDSGEAEAKKLADTLRDVLQSKGDHAPILSSPLSGAFRTMHSTLGIRTRTAPPSPADTSAGVKKAVMFLQLIGRTFMMLVADTAAARQTRIVAAVQCAYLYQYTYLPKTPLSFATVLFQNCSAELQAARDYLCREADVPSSVAEERRHRPWITLMDALHEMVRVWKSLDARLYAQDSARADYERFVRDFRCTNPHATQSPVKASAGQAEAGAEACTPRNGALELSAEGADTGTGSGSGSGSGNGAKKSQLVTPSARPTPRRVVSKSYSTTASDWKGKQSTPVGHGGGAVAPQVMLSSPASDYTQGASDFSVESSTVGPFSSALRPVVLSPQHPSMRFAWGSRVCGTTTQPSSASPAPTVSVVAVSATAASATSAAVAVERSDAAMTECTVYITKMPSCFTSQQVRRLLLHFGDFRKVRLCHDDKETTRGRTAEAVAAHQLKFHELCFGFVEFVEAGSARAMVEFFRNEVHTPTAFDFLRSPGEVAFDEAELNMLRSTRTSQARNPIHDQQPTDATRTAPCFFGLIRPQHTIETYAEAVTADDVAAAVKALEAAQQPPAQQAPAAAPLGWPNMFTTAAAATPSPTTASAPTVAASLQPMENVHFPDDFPYHRVFAEPSDNDSDKPPVVVEDDDDNGEGMTDHAVLSLLESFAPD